VNAEFDDGEVRHTGLHIGVVVERDDDELVGRVKVRVPGLIEPASAWAFPLGTVGGGSDARGFFAVPEVGAEVGVLFHQGDVDHPFYLCGHWGKPDGKTEVPTPVRGLSKSDAPQVRAFETKRYLLTFDDRSGHELLAITDKSTGHKIELKGGQSMNVLADSVSLHANKDAHLEGQNTVVHADQEVKVEGQTVTIAGGGPAAARVGDDVAPGADLITWMTSVTTAISALAPGAVKPFTSASIGSIAKGSSKVTIG
jgi:uncharacterized protein involved in type VI secretion and phage assembly